MAQLLGLRPPPPSKQPPAADDLDDEVDEDIEFHRVQRPGNGDRQHVGRYQLARAAVDGGMVTHADVDALRRGSG
jgi:hypothetical protein